MKPKQIEILLRARRVLFDVTPTQSDCGTLCDAACCRGGDGMWLFPGEASLYDVSDDPHLTVEHADGNYDYDFLRCTHDGGGCDRNARPLACRIFPYFPMAVYDSRLRKYTIRVVVDPRAARVCPLLHEGSPVMSSHFRHAVLRAGRLLLRDRETRQYLIATSEFLMELFRLV